VVIDLGAKPINTNISSEEVTREVIDISNHKEVLQ
jgi:hypothetical protein